MRYYIPEPLVRLRCAVTRYHQNRECRTIIYEDKYYVKETNFKNLESVSKSWARKCGFDNHVQTWIHEKTTRACAREKKNQFHGKMTVVNKIWQAYLTLQVSLILPLILIIAANVGVVASTIEKKCQNIWDNKDKSKFKI